MHVSQLWIHLLIIDCLPVNGRSDSSMTRRSTPLIDQERLPASKPTEGIELADECNAGQTRLDAHDDFSDSQCCVVIEPVY
jgi:hypothetical protein